MILIGRYFSPFVRRVGATLHHYGLDFEHRPIKAAGAEQDEIRRANPLGRVPALILDDGEVLSDSAVILDYLDDLVGPEKALVPAGGNERFRLQSLIAIANGAAEKAIAVFSENARPEDKRHAPYVENCTRQAKDGFQYLEQRVQGPWMCGEALTQLDITVAAHWGFMPVGTPEVYAAMDCPNIDALSERAFALPAFQATQFEV